MYKRQSLNTADAVCYEAEKLLADYGDKLESGLKERIEAKLKEAKEAVQSSDIALAKERSEALKELMKEAGSAIYAQTQGTDAQASTQQGTEQKGADTPYERVVDADFHEST